MCLLGNRIVKWASRGFDDLILEKASEGEPEGIAGDLFFGSGRDGMVREVRVCCEMATLDWRFLQFDDLLEPTRRVRRMGHPVLTFQCESVARTARRAVAPGESEFSNDFLKIHSYFRFTIRGVYRLQK